jgi:hypothetical protein
VIADVNGDSFPDVVVPRILLDSVAILLGDGTGALTPLPFISVSPLGGQPVEVVVVDINLDGEADIVTANNLTGHLSLLLSRP